jgi:hypothetical protein
MKKSSTKKTATAKGRKGRPSKASLREAPPLREGDDVVEFGRGQAGLKRALEWARVRKGRPKKGEKAAGTVTKTVRLPEAAWKALEKVAKNEGTTVHALIRQAVLARLGVAA